MVREIPLTQGKVALVDDGDYERLSELRWHAVRAKRKHHPDTFYAVHSLWSRDGNGQVLWGRLYMHREVLGVNADVDHKDGNGLNNQRANLRNANDSLNQANRIHLSPEKSSRFRGVTLHKQLSKWQASICCQGVRRYLGVFDAEEDAARAYDAAAALHFGQFARLNFPNGGAS